MRILTTFLSLAFAVVSFSQSDCGWQPDSDENNFISVTDILAILAVFGQADVDQDGIWDASDVCIDPEACNYAADPSVPCDFLDAAGICGGSNDIPALLIGSWALSTAAGAVEVGPSPGSNEWYSSGSNGLQSAQYDDIYTFQTNGSLIADYNGSIIDAFADYSEQGFSCTPIDFDFNASDTSGDASTIELSAASTSCSCPFIGTNDAGLIYTITTLTSNTLQLQAQGDDSNCNEADLYFTFTFVRLNNESGDGTGYPAPESYPGMTLVWSDEFDGSAVNTENWTYDLGASGWGNNEWQNYTNSVSNSDVSNGFLTITARQEGSSYTSARLKTQGLQDFQYGRIDIRAKLPEGQGIWPALWMLGISIADGGWPQCGEIDIMEMVGHEPGTVHGTAHWGSSWNVHQYNGSSIGLPNGEHFSEAFHLFSVDWQEDQITWYMDDQEYYSITSSQMNGQPYPFNDSFFFIMNIAVGGNWPGYPDASTSFPQEMIVDCVRVFQ
ncbi:glycoside hydrolase family 16 protein [Flavobacteriales bacterium]|nr:glycoside hydrolase family 16 protein [Flavobacteriales bacterium]